MKKLSLSLLTLTLLLFTILIPVRADQDDVPPTRISARTSKNLTVTVGEELELKVRMTPKNADDDALRWTIVSGKKVVSFTDDDRNDDEIELKAIKAGTAKVRCRITGTSKKVTFKITVKEKTTSASTIKRVGASKRTVSVGREFELEVKKSRGLKDRYLTWSIKDSSIARFDDDDLHDDEMEFKALKAGTTTITCKNSKTGKKVTYTITVK